MAWKDLVEDPSLIIRLEIKEIESEISRGLSLGEEITQKQQRIIDHNKKKLKILNQLITNR